MYGDVVVSEYTECCSLEVDLFSREERIASLWRHVQCRKVQRNVMVNVR